MIELYGLLKRLMNVDLPTWFNNEFGWFFKNGNKMNDSLIKNYDGAKLFTDFMELMRSPEKDYYDGTLDIKLKTLYENGQNFGF